MIRGALIMLVVWVFIGGFLLFTPGQVSIEMHDFIQVVESPHLTTIYQVLLESPQEKLSAIQHQQVIIDEQIAKIFAKLANK